MPLAEDTDSFELPPVSSAEDIPIEFTPELACPWKLAEQASQTGRAGSGVICSAWGRMAWAHPGSAGWAGSRPAALLPAAQAFKPCLSDGASQGCCSILADQTTPASHNAFTACLCHPAFWQVGPLEQQFGGWAAGKWMGVGGLPALCIVGFLCTCTLFPPVYNSAPQYCT